MTRVLFLLFILSLSALSHVAIARWTLRSFPRLEKRRAAVYAVACALALLPLSRFLHVNWIFTVASAEVLAAALAALPIALMAIGFDVLHAKTKPSASALTRRQVIEGAAGSFALAGTSGVFGWGAARGRHEFVIEEVVVRVPNLPRVLDGYTIAQVSDIHTGLSVQERELEEGLSRARALKPDLIVATGDLVDFDPSYIPKLARALGALRARDGVHAILGNHDYYADARAITDALGSAGVRVLVNEGVLLREGDGGGFALLGVDDLWSRRYGARGPRLDLAEAMVPVDRPRILLSHQPQTVDLWAGRIALQLSGHTHGGQINPGFSPARWVLPYVAGRYEVRGTTLWVNRGFGVAGPPVRVGAPPEVTKIVLVSA